MRVEHDCLDNPVTKRVTESEPLEHPVAEGQRVIDAAKEAGLTVRLIGGTAIRDHSESAREEPFERGYRDVDFVIVREDKNDVIDLMIELGYEENEQINRLRRYRLEFHDTSTPIVWRFSFWRHVQRWVFSDTYI